MRATTRKMNDGTFNSVGGPKEAAYANAEKWRQRMMPTILSPSRQFYPKAAMMITAETMKQMANIYHILLVV